MRKVKIELTQPHHDAEGNVLHQPGELFDEGDKVLKDLPPGSFRAVIVDDHEHRGDGLSTEEKGTTPEGWAVDKDGEPAARPDYLDPDKNMVPDAAGGSRPADKAEGKSAEKQGDKVSSPPRSSATKSA